ncbi:MAG: hypothetical protein ACJAX3_000379 [Patiriisocius sp.]|jgi:hypothetical protein
MVTVATTPAQIENLALTYANAQITNDVTDSFYEVDVIATKTATSPDFELGTGQFYKNYNDAAFGTSIGDATVDFEYPEGSILGENTPGGIWQYFFLLCTSNY